MTEPDSTFEEEIRRALCTAGDLVVPAGDGLQKIRERAVYRRHPLAWLFADAAHLLTRPFGWLRVAASELAATARGHSSLAPRLGPARTWPRAMRATLRSPGVWLRPVLAATATLVIVLAVTLAFPRLRSQVAGLSGLGTSPSQGGPGSGGGTAYGSGSTESSASSSLPIRVTPGQPVDALMPAAGSSRCQSAVPGHSGQAPYMPPAPGPGPSQTIGAGPLALGRVNAAAAGAAGARAIAQSSPCAPSASPTTLPASTPPTLPVTTPPTTPVTTSPTTPPVTTPPPTSPPVTTTPPTTPPTTTAGDGSGSPSPTGTASPG
jgi:hypothetical protein